MYSTTTTAAPVAAAAAAVAAAPVAATAAAPVAATAAAPVAAAAAAPVAAAAAAPAALPKRKRQKKSTILHVSDFNIEKCVLKPLVKNPKCNLVPMTLSAERDAPVLVQLSGRGRIPRSFGIEDKELDGRRKVTLSFQVDDQEEHDHLVRIRTELVDSVVPLWQNWFPNQTTPSKDVIDNFCTKLVSDRKPKSTGDGMWSGLGKAAIDPADCASGRCKIVDTDGVAVSLEDLGDRTWSKMVLEFRYVYVQTTRRYGITKKLRYLLVEPDEEEFDVEPL